MKHFLGLLPIFVLVCSLLTAGHLQGQSLTRAADVLALDGSNVENLSRPVELRGVVLGVSTMFNFFALHDGTGTVGVFRRKGQEIKQGDVIELTGRTTLMPFEGHLCPRVLLDDLRTIGTAELPAAKPIPYKLFSAPENYDQWVSLEGFVVRWDFRAPDLHVEMATPEGRLEAKVTVPESSQLPQALNGARLRLTGTIVSTPTLGRVLFVPDLKQLHILEAGSNDVFEAPLASLQQITQKSVESAKRWRIQGKFAARTRQRNLIVTAQGAAIVGQLLLPRARDGADILYGDTGQWPALRPGDQVELVGSILDGADLEPSLYGLQDCHVRVIAQEDPPVPTVADLPELHTFQAEDRWVTVSGVVTAWNLQGDAMTYTVLSPTGYATIRAQESDAPPPDLHGAILKFTGITRRFSPNRSEHLLVPNPSLIERVKPGTADPFLAPLLPTGRIAAIKEPSAQPVRTRGIVLGRPAGSHAIHIRGKGGALRLHLPLTRQGSADSMPIAAGDEVEAVGSPIRPSVGPPPAGSDLYECLIRVIAHASPPTPIESTLPEISGGKHRADLVKVRGRLLSKHSLPVNENQSRTSILLEQDGAELLALFEGPNRTSFETLKVDDEVLLSGLAVHANAQDPLHVRLLSEGDAKSLGLSPSVRARKLWLWGGGGTALFALLIGWIVVLRRSGAAQQKAAAELKAASEAARDSEQRWKLLFEQSPLSVQIFAPDGQTKRFNQAWSRLFRLSDQEAYAFNVLHAPDLIASGAVNHIRKAFEGEVVHVPPVPYPVPAEPNEPPDLRWIGGVLYPVKNEAGQIMEVVTIHNDITEIKHAEESMLALNQTLEQRVNERTEELKQAQSDLLRSLEHERELNELKSRFVTMVSHEFRTPLGIIMSAVELMRHYEERLPPEQRRELCEDIFNATRVMASLMEQVLVLGRVEAGKLGCRRAPVDIDLLVNKLTDETLSATNHKCPVQWQALNSLDNAQGDEGLLRHIFSNLISNAIKYSPPNTKVEVTARREDSDCLFQVIDRGIGIPSAELPRLFEAFYRCANVGDIPGTGLGLLIVKRCVELHGGDIQIDSVAGQGTTFTVRLPMF